MTRLEQAQRWWNANAQLDEQVSHAKIPLRHVRTLRKAGQLQYEYKLFWRRKIFKAGKDKGLEAFEEILNDPS